MSQPLAYLITWTCYGSWLHGDERGSVDKKHNLPGEEFVVSDSTRMASEAGRLPHAPVMLDAECRNIVAETTKAHCQFRGWELLACNVRTNHVHVVIAYPEIEPEKMMTQLKAWSTRKLREANCFDQETRIWTRHGSTRYLWDEQNVEGAIDYVLERQGPIASE